MNSLKRDNREVPAHHAAAEQHRKRLATWVAATGTLAVIVALWLMLLPTQLGGLRSFGLKHSPSWMTLPDGTPAEEAPTYMEALDRMRAMLDRAEGEERTRIERERAARDEADRLRERIESATAEPAVNSAEPTPQ